jgi:hypothetical protein
MSPTDEVHTCQALHVDFPGPQLLDIDRAQAKAIKEAEAAGKAPPLLPEMLPVLFPVCGAGSLYLRAQVTGSGAPIWEKVVDFIGLPWHRDGRQPASWWLEYSPKLQRPILFVAAAPEVEVFQPGSVRYLPVWHVPQLQVVRVASADLVPRPGLPVRLHELIGQERHLTNGVDPADPELTVEEQFILNHATADVPVVIQPALNSVRIRHQRGHWDCKLRIEQPNLPGGFVYQVLPAHLEPAPPPGIDPPARVIANQPGMPADGDFAITLRVVTTPGVRVELMKADHPTQSTLSPFETVSEVHLLHAEVEPRFLPLPGDDLGTFMLDEITTWDSGLSDDARFWAMVLEAAVGFVPVVGTVMDLAQLAYMAGYGETFWGEDASSEEIFKHGVFSLLGVAVDARDAVRLFKLAGELYPGAKLASLNPGLDEAYAWTVGRVADPVLLDTMAKLPSEARGKLFGALESFASKGDAAGVVKTFDEVVTAPYRLALDNDIVPEVVHARAFEAIHPASLSSFDGLATSEQDAILDLFVAYRAGTRTVSSVLDGLAPALRLEYDELFDLWRASLVFDANFQGFTVWLLQEGYRRYLARGGTRNAVQWAAAQQTGRYIDLLTQLLGRSYGRLLEKVAAEQYWEVSQTARLLFEQLANQPMRYRSLRGKLPTGLGSWLQVDHVFEKRFMKRPQFAEFEIPNPDDFTSLLVARNPAVASQLASHAYYVHSVKTELLRRLIPHHLENGYRLQQIVDAYHIVFRHQLGLSRDVFEGLLLDDFRALRELGHETFTYRHNESLASILRRNPGFVAAVNMPMP